MSNTTSTTHESDVEHGYRLIIDHAIGLHHGDPVPPRWVLPLRCRPSELQRRLDEWARGVAAKLEPVLATYFLVCRAYLIHPWSAHEVPAESILAIQPTAPSCLQSMAHDWRIIDPFARVCSRCGLHHEHHEASSWPWEIYSRSEDYEVGEEERRCGIPTTLTPPLLPRARD